ncbi:hypothetical protein ElyMa_006138400 [Elysia marginata]|uniref:Tc1-like transposase DDE domain-containing protein n=1 Tax=Elysia marginata TaxID=1093978 RepID=A0AAV4H096_9GAST|nr:hypothetical protein ElyMa_006138400 [Elysia marginata]
MHSTTRRCCKTNSDLPYERNDPGCCLGVRHLVHFHHDNAPVHTARAVTLQTFWLATKGDCWRILAIHLTLPPVIFTYSLK